MKRFVCLLVLPWITGCVERSFTIQSDPPGALVLRNGEPIGSTPVTENFVYYGVYELTLVKEGYEPLVVKQKIERPWYQYPFVDFVFEHLVPVHLQDRKEFIYKLAPRRHIRTDELLDQANDRRAIGRTLGDKAPAPLPLTPEARPPQWYDPPPPPK